MTCDFLFCFALGPFNASAVPLLDTPTGRNNSQEAVGDIIGQVLPFPAFTLLALYYEPNSVALYVMAEQ